MTVSIKLDVINSNLIEKRKTLELFKKLTTSTLSFIFSSIIYNVSATVQPITFTSSVGNIITLSTETEDNAMSINATGPLAIYELKKTQNICNIHHLNLIMLPINTILDQRCAINISSSISNIILRSRGLTFTPDANFSPYNQQTLTIREILEFMPLNLERQHGFPLGEIMTRVET